MDSGLLSKGDKNLTYKRVTPKKGKGGGLSDVQMISTIKQSILFDNSKSDITNFMVYLLFAYWESLIFDFSHTIEYE